MTAKLRVPRQASPERTIADHDYLMMRGLARNVRAALVLAGGDVLDLGCGRKPYRPWLAPHVSYIGVDVDPRGSDPDVVGLGTAIPFRDACFDTVLCLEVIEHVPDPFGALHEIARVLRAGGRLILSTPQSWRLHEAPYDYYRYTRYGLERLAVASGLEVEQLHAHGGVWANVGQTALNAWPHHQLGALLVPGIVLVNAVCGALDAAWHDERDPLGHLLVATKSSASRGQPENVSAAGKVTDCNSTI